MERTYLPVLLLLGFVVANAVMMLALSHFTLRSRPTPVKQESYESGIPVIMDARDRFSVKFYLVAISFIVFDVEAVLLLPWAAHYRTLSCATAFSDGVCPKGESTPYGLIIMLIFMAILSVGLLWEWKKGALQWG
jgi:NADH-quinone oxidoreductase subunit A